MIICIELMLTVFPLVKFKGDPWPTRVCSWEQIQKSLFVLGLSFVQLFVLFLQAKGKNKSLISSHQCFQSSCP